MRNSLPAARRCVVVSTALAVAFAFWSSGSPARAATPAADDAQRALQLVRALSQSAHPESDYLNLSPADRSLVIEGLSPGKVVTTSNAVDANCTLTAECPQYLPGAPVANVNGVGNSSSDPSPSPDTQGCNYGYSARMTQQNVFGNIELFKYYFVTTECTSGTKFTSPTYTSFTPVAEVPFWTVQTETGHVDEGIGTPIYHSEDSVIFSMSIGILNLGGFVKRTGHWSYTDSAATIQGPAWTGSIQ